MQIDIQPSDQLDETQERALRALSNAVHPSTETTADPYPDIQWAAPHWRVLIWDEDAQLVSHVGVITREADYNGKRVVLGGVGGVETHPQARKQGYAGAGLVRAGEFLRKERGVDFALLFCSEELLRFYGRFGWQHFRGDVLIMQTTGKAKITAQESMVLPGKQTAPLNGVLDLCGNPW